MENVLINTTKVRVRYAETDKMGVVNNVVYLEYFEVGRAELMRSYGLPYIMLEDAGYLLPVIEAHLDYKSSAFYDDLLDIKCTYEYEYKPTMKFNYEIYRNDILVVSGYTIHSYLKNDTRKPVKPPKIFVEALMEIFRKVN
jgi:acyl-CoA thioester hydrolase